MPRTKRKRSATSIYHVVIKGADHQLLFEESSDYRKYLSFLEYYKSQCHFELFAYCLMSNHVHLLLRLSPDFPLETIFRRLNTAYAVWFNMKYNRTGFVQNGRYYSEPVEDEHYVLATTRYIHYNPTNAGLENAPGSSYPWTSYYDYLNFSVSAPSLTDTSYLFQLLGSSEHFFQLHTTATDSSVQILDIHTIRRRLPDDVAADIIFKISGCRNTTEFQKLSLLNRNHFIRLIHQKGVSIRQINRLTGTPKGVIDRIIRKSKTSS